MSVNVPDVFPLSETSRIIDCVCTLWLKAEIVTAFPDWLNVILLPPASVIVPDEIAVSVPDVLPDKVTSCRC